MADDRAAIASLVLMVMLLWGYLSGGFIGRPHFRRTLNIARDVIVAFAIWLGRITSAIARRAVYVGVFVVAPLAVLYFLVRFVKWAWAD